jgi:hypothetical protein
MADRHNTHNGRDVDGRFRVRQVDVDDLLEDPAGVDALRDDVRLGGAIADTGAQAGMAARHLGDLIDANREDVGRATGRTEPPGSSRRKRGRS